MVRLEEIHAGTPLAGLQAVHPITLAPGFAQTSATFDSSPLLEHGGEPS